MKKMISELSSVYCLFTGVRNIQALGNLISWQKVEYDFNFHKQDFLANVSVLVLSEGKSLLPVSFLHITNLPAFVLLV